MTRKEKIIKSMFSYQDQHDSIVVDKDGLANHLIANDIVPVVRCKNCEWGKTYNTVFGIEKFKCELLYVDFSPEAFCSCGIPKAERKE